MLSNYVPGMTLIATESARCQGRDGHIVSEFLVDYDACIKKTLELFSSLDIETFCQGHLFVFFGENVRVFFARSLQAAEGFRGHYR
jgi:hypothetical protein